MRVQRLSKIAAGLLVGLAIAIWGYQLIYDPWAQVLELCSMPRKDLIELCGKLAD